MILHWLEHFAAATPAKTAVRGDGAALTYADFLKVIELTATEFRKGGCRPGTLAAVLCERRIEGWILLLALQRAGLATMAVGSEAALAAVAPSQLRYVVRARAGAERGAGPRTMTFNVAQVDAPADDAEPPLELGHLLLSSATTGRAKAVLISSRIQEMRCAKMVAATGAHSDTVLGLGGFGHWTAVGYNCAAAVWRAGGQVVLDPGPAGGPDLLAPDLTEAVATPAMLAASLRLAPDRPPRSACKLRLVGAAAPWADIERASAWLGGGLVSELAATEVGAFCRTPLQTPEDNLWNRILFNRVVEVVDEGGRPCAVGETGQVRVRLEPEDAAGYVGDPQESAARFREGCFYPGDLGVLDSQGRLALQGRTADVVNIAGDKRPSLPLERELEARLNVRAACILSTSEPAEGDLIRIVLESETAIDPALLRSTADELGLRTRIVVHVTASLPRNAMGKIDRLALQAMLKGGGAR